MASKRESAQERDERIVRGAFNACGRWSYHTNFPYLCQQWENYDLIDGTKADVYHAAARILNRLAKHKFTKAPR